MAYSGYVDYFEKPVIISVATTGGFAGKEENPNLPVRPDEVVDDVVACAEAGASIVHLHARDDDGNQTKDVERYQELRDRITENCDILVNFTTGESSFSRAARLRPVIETHPGPDIATIDMGPLNVGTDHTAENTRDQCKAYARAMHDRGIKPELEVFHQGQIEEVKHLIEEGLIERPYWCTAILGFQSGAIPRPRNLLNFVDNFPIGTEWQALAIGKHQLPLTTMAMVLGGHVRVGLEDNLYYRRGVLAESNAQLVNRAARIADELERPVATTADARNILGL